MSRKTPEQRRANGKAWREANPTYHLEYYAKNAERLKARQYWNRYGLTRAQVVALFESQAGRCAICDGEMVLGGQTPASACVDHDHATDEVRGMLCSGCNKGIGYLRESERILSKAIDYLKTPRARLVLVKGGQ